MAPCLTLSFLFGYPAVFWLSVVVKQQENHRALHNVIVCHRGLQLVYDHPTPTSRSILMIRPVTQYDKILVLLLKNFKYHDNNDILTIRSTIAIMNLFILHMVLFGSVALALPLALPLTPEEIAHNHLLASQELAKAHQVHSHNTNIDVNKALAKNDLGAASHAMKSNINAGMARLEQMDHHEAQAAQVHPWMNPPRAN
jgi:hypothetical protein